MPFSFFSECIANLRACATIRKSKYDGLHKATAVDNKQLVPGRHKTEEGDVDRQPERPLDRQRGPKVVAELGLKLVDRLAVGQTDTAEE